MADYAITVEFREPKDATSLLTLIQAGKRATSIEDNNGWESKIQAVEAALYERVNNFARGKTEETTEKRTTSVVYPQI